MVVEMRGGESWQRVAGHRSRATDREDGAADWEIGGSIYDRWTWDGGAPQQRWYVACVGSMTDDACARDM